jgi:hypothetical protein
MVTGSPRVTPRARSASGPGTTPNTSSN